MWVTRLSIVDWVYSKNQILLVTLRIQNPLREESNVSFEAEHLLFLLLGCARNKRQYPTVVHNQKSFRRMLDCKWKDFLLLIYGIVVTEVLRSNSTKPPTNPAAGNCSRKSQIQHQTKGKPRCGAIVACGLRHHKRTLFSRWLSVVHLWRQWSSDQNDHQGQKSNNEIRVSRTHRVALDWLFDRINLDTRIQIKHVDTENQLADMLTKGNFTRDEMSGTILFICWISWISRCSPAAIFFQTEGRVSCPRELKKALRKMSRQWPSRDQWIWCQGTSWVRRKILRKIWVIQRGWWIKIWINVVFHPATNVFSREATRWHPIFQGVSSQRSAFFCCL